MVSLSIVFEKQFISLYFVPLRLRLEKGNTAMAWQIDPVHSHIQFSVRHMMLAKVRGHFDKFSGTIQLDEANPAAATVDVQIEAASINTREAQRDGHLKSPDLFDVTTYPTLHFKSKRVEVQDAHHAVVVGDLTIRDVTKEVALDVEYMG